MKLLLFNFLFTFILFGDIYAQDVKIQSGIIYYFTNFVEWPSSKSSGDFIIGVIGKSDIKPYLDKLASIKKVGTRKIVIKSLSAAADAKSCHIIYLPKSMKSEFESAKGVAKAGNCLLVTEAPGMGKKGSGINFIVKNGKPSFEINESVISACGLKVSAKLKSLGTVI